MASSTVASQTNSAAEDAEIQQWLTTAERLKAPDAEKSSILEALNTHLAPRTTLLGAKPSRADVAIYETLAPAVKAWTPEERTGKAGHPHIVRHLDFVQNSPLFGLDIKGADKVEVDVDEVLYVVPPVDAKAEKERLKEEQAAAPDTEEHDGQVVRTVCSGLNGLVPLEEMQGRKVVVVCNLKPVKMRGIKSAAMVLAASPKLKEGEVADHSGPVELVNPPPTAKAGERVYFEGWKGDPEKQLNPKKKVWEMFQPGFTTTDDLEVGFEAAVVKELGKEGLGKLVAESGGVCTVKSLKGAQVR